MHVLDDDSLLNIFHLCRPRPFEEDEDGDIQWDWREERWWYKLVQACRRWRYLILGSASHLRLCLVCTPGTPVADMLAHSPPFPLIIEYEAENRGLSAKDEEGVMLALQHRDRVYRINLEMPPPSLQKVITAINDEFPILEFLYIGPPTKHNTHLILPSTFQAPQLRILGLNHFASPIGSSLFTTAVGLSRLILLWIHPSAYPHPNQLLQTLSLLPHLKTFKIGFRSPVSKRDIERQLLQSPIITHVTLPNLHLFDFEGVSIYLEALLPHMTTPLLETLKVHFFNQLTFSIPRLLQFMTTAENLGFGTVDFLFYHGAVAVFVYPNPVAEICSFTVDVSCGHLDWQVSSVAQIFNVLSPLFSDVVDITLDYREHTLSSEWHNEVDRTQWRELLGSFRNVKTLRVHNGLVRDLSRALQLDGEPPLELLPELMELVCPVGSVNDKIFSAFINEREVAGQPVKVIGETFPVGRSEYTFISSNGTSHIDPDPL
jgi:hypothetical protein